MRQVCAFGVGDGQGQGQGMIERRIGVQIHGAHGIAFELHRVVGCTLTPLASLGTFSRGRERGDKDEELIKVESRSMADDYIFKVIFFQSGRDL